MATAVDKIVFRGVDTYTKVYKGEELKWETESLVMVTSFTNNSNSGLVFSIPLSPSTDWGIAFSCLLPSGSYFMSGNASNWFSYERNSSTSYNDYFNIASTTFFGSSSAYKGGSSTKDSNINALYKSGSYFYWYTGSSYAGLGGTQIKSRSIVNPTNLTRVNILTGSSSATPNNSHKITKFYGFSVFTPSTHTILHMYRPALHNGNPVLVDTIDNSILEPSYNGGDWSYEE